METNGSDESEVPTVCGSAHGADHQGRDPSCHQPVLLRWRRIYISDTTELRAWYVKVRNAVFTASGDDSQHAKQLEHISNERHISYVSSVKTIMGVSSSALDDLENGFLVGQEFLVAGEVFDSVLEQARGLLDGDYKDVAAMLGRVVLEDARRRIARQEGMDSTERASKLNDD